MHTIDTVITIEAEPETVWSILVDFARYEEWNPFILRGTGQAVVGQTLKVDIRPPGDKEMTHQPTVITVEPARHLAWLGKVSIPGILAARHEFVLEPAGTGTELRQKEGFSGLIVPFLKATLRRTEQGFHEMNQALKARAEATTN